MSRREIRKILERAEELLERIGDELDEVSNAANEERIALLHEIRAALTELASNGG